MQNALRNFIREMDSSMAVPRISVERVKATAGVITATLMMSQICIAICPMTILVELSLHVQVPDHILLTRGIQSFPHTVVIIARRSHKRRDNILTTADVSAARISLPAGKPLGRSQLKGHHHRPRIASQEVKLRPPRKH